VEQVDADIISQPPRNVNEPLINKSLIVSIISSAAIIITGTLFVFYKEVSKKNINLGVEFFFKKNNEINLIEK
jgi:P-type Ca2+ transporter type 2C